MTDGPYEHLDDELRLIREEILELTRGDFDVRFPENKLLVSDWTVPGVRSAFTRLLEDPDVDMVLTWGALGSHQAGINPDLPKPVVAPFVIDREIQGFPFRNGSSGARNLVYIASHIPLGRHLEAFQDLVPFTELGFIYNPVYTETIPELEQIMLRAVAASGMKAVPVPLRETMDETLSSIPESVEAVFITPLITPGSAQFQKLVTGFKDRRLPSFSVLGKEEVEKGILAGIAPRTDMSRLTRRVGLIFQRILLGDDPRDIPVAFQRGEQLTINMETARAIQFYPDWNSLTEAELLYEEEARAGRRLTLGQAVDEAVTTNIDLAVADRTVAAGEQDIREARSLLKPQLEVSSLGLIIDEDRAEGSFGTQAERTLTGSITLNQLLYEDSARANVQIQQHLQDSRELGRERVRSDIAQEAATAYLNILKAQTFMQIQKDNLKLTRSNLELARTRKEIGISGPAEVYRWESQIAIDKGFVLEAQALESRTRIALNRILKRPLEEPFITVDVKLGDPLLITSDRRIMKYIDNPWTFGVFRDFMVREGLKASPELKALTAAIGAQERSVLAAKRDYTSPTVGLEVDVTQVLSESGKGSQGLPGGPDDTDWSVGVSVSLPLATGGARDAELQRASEDLEGLRLEYQAASDRVEQRIRSALHIARASFADIQLAQDAAESAQKNLDLVTDSYARGVVSITELLDAQEAVLRAELAAANAVYDFMIDLIEVERSVNRFGFFVTPDERNEWFQDLKLYFISRGEKVPE